MGKINTEIAIFIVFLILLAFWGLFIRVPVEDTKTTADELKVSGMYVQFENGTSDHEVATILKNCNMTMDYSIKYNIDSMANEYYIMLDKDERDVRRELSEGMKEDNKIGWCLLRHMLSGEKIIT